MPSLLKEEILYDCSKVRITVNFAVFVFAVCVSISSVGFEKAWEKQSYGIIFREEETGLSIAVKSILVGLMCKCLLCWIRKH